MKGRRGGQFSRWRKGAGPLGALAGLDQGLFPAAGAASGSGATHSKAGGGRGTQRCGFSAARSHGGGGGCPERPAAFASVSKGPQGWSLPPPGSPPGCRGNLD